MAETYNIYGQWLSFFFNQLRMAFNGVGRATEKLEKNPCLFKLHKGGEEGGVWYHFRGKTEASLTR